MTNSYTHLAKVYDALNYDCDYATWSQYLLKFIPEKSGKGLDFACGSGKMTQLFAKSGFSMVGVDSSREMLSVAQSGKKANDSVYVFGDMCSVKLARKFDFINVSCDGVNYLNPKTQFQPFLTNCQEHLKPGGTLLFDVSSEYKLRHVLGNHLFADDTEDVTYIWQNEFCEKTNTLNFCMILFTKDGEQYLKSYEQHKMFLYGENFLKEELKSFGFQNVAVYDAFTLNPPNEKSQRLQVVCKNGG